MTAEVISFKTKDTSAQDIEVIKTFLRNINAVESYNFFFLDATRSANNTTLEIMTWEKYINELRESVLQSITASHKDNIKEFLTMVNGVDDLCYGGLVGVAFSCHIGTNIVINWSFMLCKLHDDKYIIRDLVRNGKRIIVRG